MRKILFYFILGFGSFAFSGKTELTHGANLDAKQNKIIKEISFQQVIITDKFWRPRIDKNRIVGIRLALKEAMGNIDNFDIAAGKKKGKHNVGVGDDSNVFKIIEGSAYALSDTPDPALEASIDSLIEKIVAAQQPDGYLGTYWIINDISKKWTDIPRKHELYCAGHMIEAAVAYYKVTGKRKLLDAAIRLANHIDTVFGIGKRMEAPGHEEIELALYKLYKTTSQKKYLKLATFFVDERGDPKRMIAEKVAPPDKDPNASSPQRWRPPSYMQDHLPVTQQFYAVGHAVRATYLYTAMADISMEGNDRKYMPALNSIWDDIVGKKIYITGGIGTKQFHDEGFGSAYLLPNDQAYCETCSGIGFIFWNRRMSMLTGDAKFADMAELTMYNAALAGISLSGDKYFYTNPLESKGKATRQPWDEPPCCPTNMTRFLPEIGSTIYAKTEEDIYINQFIGNKAKIPMGNQQITLNMETEYPWDGKIILHVDPQIPVELALHIRIPGWARNELISGGLYSYVPNQTVSKAAVVIKVNGSSITNFKMEKGYAVIQRKWKKSDKIEIELPMQVRLIEGNIKIVDTHDKIVISRGPLVYCVEETDNNNYFKTDDKAYMIPTGLSMEYKKDLLNGVVIIHGAAVSTNNNKETNITAIPYYVWCNRDQGQMKVWLPFYMKKN